MKTRITALALLIVFATLAFAQSQQSLSKPHSSIANVSFLKDMNDRNNLAFVENAGQLDFIKDLAGKKILYGFNDEQGMKIYFTATGLIYHITKAEKVSEREWEKYVKANHISVGEEEEEEREKKEKGYFIPKTHVVEMKWSGANPEPQTEVSEPLSFYFNYYLPDVDRDKVVGNVHGYKHLIYKSVYPNIDVEFAIHPEKGIKYSFILHPGADPSQIQMAYSNANLKWDAQDVLLSTPLGNITDHAPLTYKGLEPGGKLIDSRFVINKEKNSVGFKLADNITSITETTVIDPWQVGPSFPVNKYWPEDVAVDGSGNVLVYSHKPASFPFAGAGRIDKYSSTGTFIWTFDLAANAQYTNFQGDIAADPAGSVYANIGLGPNSTGYYNTIKINSAGSALLWGNSTAGTGTNNMYESWTITFNCPYTVFYQSGGGRVKSGTTWFNVSVEEPVNAATGAEGTLIENDSMGDIICTYYAPNNLIYHMTSDSNVTPDLAGATSAPTSGAGNNLVCFDPATGNRLFRVHSGYSFVDGAEKAPGSVGINAMVSSGQYLYTMNGTKLDRWNSTTGFHYNQVTITGGSSGSGTTNSGILTDKCGNVYVGANGKIYVYDPLLNLTNTITGLPGIVFDMRWNSTFTEIVVCGGNSNTTSFLASVAVTPCTLPFGYQTTITATQPTCAAPGSATATPTFPGAPYSYSWSNGQTTQTATNLSPGTYTVTVSGSGPSACPFTYVVSQTVTINPAPGTPTVTVNSASICAGSSATLTASGATTYSWSPATGLSSTSSATVTANPGVTTIYTVTGTTSGCSGTATSTVTVTPIPTVTVNSATICAGTSTTLTASGATTFSWSPGTGLSSTSGSTVTANPSSTTIYTITGTTSGCTGTNTSTVTVNPSPTVSVNSPTICSGNSTNLIASGATTYSWSPGTGLSSTTGATVTANPTSTTTYTVTGTTAGCSGTNTAVLTVNPTPTISVNAATICPGATATLTATGATSYTWSPATGLSGTSGATVTASPTVTTTYTIVGDAASCQSSTTTTVTVSGSLNITVNSPAICEGNSTTLNASGASTYSWSPATGLSSTSGASVIANPTVTTTYTVVGSAGTCSATATSTVTVNPAATPTANASPAVICNGASSTLTASGATSYSWSTGSSATSISVSPTSNTTYTLYGTIGSCTDSTTVTVNVTPLPSVTVTAAPATICSGQSSTLTASGASTYTWSANAANAVSSTVTVSPNATDTYTVTGENASCTSTATITVNVTPTPTLSTSALPTAICVGQSSVISVSGASTYTWSSNAGSSNSTTVTVSPSSTDVYTVTGEQAGCTGIATVTVTVNPLPTLTVTSAPSNNICAGQSATLTVSGAATYTWSANAGSATTNTVSVSPVSTTNYSVAGTTINGCTDSTIISVFVTSPPVLAASATQDTICVGQSTTLTASGASNYTWSPGGQNNPSIVVTPTVTSTYTVIGSNGGCSDSTTVLIKVNPVPTLTISPSPANICSGQTVTLTASGATTYTWSANAGSATTSTVSVSPVATATYIVAGSDSGCLASKSVVVNVTTTPTVSAVASPTTICSGGSALLTASGAANYAWSANAGSVLTSTASVSPTTGPVTYTVVGANGTCFGTATVTLNVNPTPTVSLASFPTSICAGQSATLTATGAASYTWNPTGMVNDSLIDSPVNTTTYVVTADLNGCPGTGTVVLTVNPTPTLGVISSQTVCAGGPVQTTNFSGSAGATYNWTNSNAAIGLGTTGNGTSIPGYTAPSVATQQTGTINVTPSIGTCSGTSQSFIIIINPIPTVTPLQPDSATCSLSNGGYEMGVSGGTAPLTISWQGPTGTVAGANTATLTGAAAGTYTIMVMDANGCMASGPSSIVVVPGSTQPIAVVGANPTQGQAPLNVNFSNTSIGASSYNWNFGNGTGATTQTAATTYTAAGVYVVTLTAYNAGCQNSDTVTILVTDATSIIVPNVFSPNGDGINEEFGLITTGVKTLVCDIFNRWGQKIYSLASPAAKWSGTLDNGNHATEGTYYYVYEATGYDGKTYSGKGHITLVK